MHNDYDSHVRAVMGNIHLNTITLLIRYQRIKPSLNRKNI
jgi:hypothetical protein